MLGPTPSNVTLTDDDVRTELQRRLGAHLPLTADGYRVDTEMLLDVLLHAASTGTSVEAACDELLEAADANTVRDYINKQLGSGEFRQLDAFEDAVNAALATGLPRKVRRGRLEVAFDEHDQPFYGRSGPLRELACRGRAKAGTTRFFRIATAYVLRDGVRLTLAVIFVRPNFDRRLVVQLLELRVRALGLRIRRLWLDRGFACVPVFYVLTWMGIPAVIACPIRGQPGQGTRRLCAGRASYQTDHTFRNRHWGSLRVPVTVVKAFFRFAGRRRLRWMLFVQLGTDLSPHQVRHQYRRRFGIESSYRCMRQVRIRTNTRQPALRFLYMSIGLIIVNVWTLLRFCYCQVPRRGRAGRPVDGELLKLRRLALFLQHAVERRYGSVTSIQALTLPLHAESVVH